MDGKGTITPAERMAWLIRLRWIALGGVLLSTLAARLLDIRGVNEPVIFAAVAGGLLYNAFFARELRKNPGRRHDPLLQVLPDFGALTVVLWASGGVSNPFLSLYFVHVLLVTTLGGRRTFLLACTAALVSAAFLLAAEAWPAFKVSSLDTDPTSWAFLSAAAFAVTVVGSAFVADRAQSELMLRKREAEAAGRERQRNAEILMAALDRLDVGVEILQPDGTATLRNRHLRSQQGTALCLKGPSHGCQSLGTPCSMEEARRGKSGSCRFSVKDRGGRERVVELLSFPLSDETPAPVLRLHVDRTESILAERKLLFAERLASLGRTVQAVAHELNTPLATIQTLAADMRAALADPPDEARELAKDLDESASLILDEMRRCRSITQGLLAGRDRLENGKGGDLDFALDRAATLLFGAGAARATLEIAPALRGQVAAMNPDALVQVFLNLLQNAQDAIADREGAKIRVLPLEVGEELAVAVDDDGPGFPFGMRDRLIEPFYTTKPPGKGTGLGLYTAQSLLREAGGRLELADAPGGGARAIAFIPRGEAA